MLITEITEATNGRKRIRLEDGSVFLLYNGEIRSFHLKEGEELSETFYQEIMTKILPKRAKLRAMNLLKAKSYTVKQLTDKLRSSEYPENIICEAIEYVSSYHYLDDRAYTKDYIEYNKEIKSKTKIIHSLQLKGISKDLAEEVYEECAGDHSRELEMQQIIALMQKKKFDTSSANYEEKQKFSAFLYRKGFQIDTIRCALSLDITSV